MPRIRPLRPATDRDAVRSLHDRAADYIMLESGLAPDDALTDAFFSDAPPGADPAASLRLGLFSDDGSLAAIAEMSFGYPEPGDAYIGLMLIDAARRGRGLGPVLLDHLMQEARARGAPRLLLAVLEANPRGRAFWERHGFRETLRTPPTLMGIRTHVRIRMERDL
ncbi:GNAT family N-acetyltransferase [Paracoccaceae bacterium Fryx2]|nr:GNAT family N-acetyltransferase [Paracoccaceae bacterium Fryx2]